MLVMAAVPASSVLQVESNIMQVVDSMGPAEWEPPSVAKNALRLAAVIELQLGSESKYWRSAVSSWLMHVV